MPDSTGRLVVTKGSTGLSAYQLALQNGFQGTEQAWLDSLKGETGDKGPALTNRGDWFSGTLYNPNDYVFSASSSGIGTSAWLLKDTLPFLSTAAPATDDTHWLEAWASPGTPAVPTTRTVNTQYSLTGGGDLSANRTLNLVGDVSSPGTNKHYGTDGSGARGWYSDAAGTADVLSDETVSVDSQLTLFSGTTGKHIKKSTGTGLLKITSGVASTITDNSPNWDTAYSQTLQWDGGSTNLVAATGRSSLGLVIGTNVQAYDPDLDALAALTGTNTIYYRSAANTWTAVTIGSGLSFSSGTLSSSGASVAWGSITGTLSSQTDLQSALDNKVPITRTVNGHALSADITITKGDLNLSNLTNDTQTRSAIVPNTAPSSGQVLVGNAGGTAYAPQSVSGSGATISLSSAGLLTISAIANASLTNSSVTINGTSNQINGGGAVSLGGSLTLSTPQNIDTAATVQFATLQLGLLTNSPASNWVAAARQSANNRPTLIAQRQTDTSPTGDFLSFYDIAATPNKLFNIDITGKITVGIWNGSTIDNAYLTNSSITIAGTSTALGGSITQDTITGLSSTGLVKRTGANALGIATAKTDYWDTTDFVASGGSHAHGLVPDPGASAGTTKFLREDATWQVPPGGGSTTLTGDVTGTGTGTITTTLANIPTAVTMAGYLAATAIAAPATPAAGIGRIYVDSTSKNLSVKDDAGVVKHGIQTRTATANNWIRSIADDGSTTISQPAFTDISGTASTGQIPALGGNPSINVGLSAVNGSATTYLRSDGAPALDQGIAPTWTGAHNFGEARTIASGASATLDDLQISAQTTTVTGTTQITTAKGFNKFSIYRPTYTDSSAVTIDQGATLYIENAPLASGSVTLTNPYALWVDSGAVRFDAGLTVGGTAAPSAGVINASTGFTITGAAAAGKILRGDGTNFVASTPTYPNAATAQTVITGDGTNFNASDLGQWDGVVKVSGTDFTTTNTTATTITGLTTPTLSNSTMYEIEIVLRLLNAADTTGMKIAISAGGSGTAATCFTVVSGNTTTATAGTVGCLNQIDTLTAPWVSYSAGEGIVVVRGHVTTRGSGTATIIAQLAKVTSNTATCRVGSTLRWRKA